jgi:hypothetical protein
MPAGLNGNRGLAIKKVIPGNQEAKMTFTAYVEWDPDTKLYVSMVPGIPGAHTQGATLDELQKTSKRSWNYA